MKIHTVAVHEGKKPFKCIICEKYFSNKGTLNNHVASVHEGIKPFKCDICETRFATKGTLKRHMAVHEKM